MLILLFSSDKLVFAGMDSLSLRELLNVDALMGMGRLDLVGRQGGSFKIEIRFGMFALILCIIQFSFQLVLSLPMYSSIRSASGLTVLSTSWRSRGVH